MEWAKVNLKKDLWKNVLSASRDVSIAPPNELHKITRRLKFKIPRLMTYRIICEALETVKGIMDAVECFHQMTNELMEETITQGEQAEWFRGERSCIPWKWYL